MTSATPAFPYKTTPFYPEQREILKRSWAMPYAFLAAEQGTGKSWMAINTMVALYLKGKIDGAVVIAPNGIHAAWAYDQLPSHMSDVVPWTAHVWSSEKELRHKRLRAKGNVHARAHGWDVLARDFTRFPILCVNSEAISVALCRKAVGTFLTLRRCLMIVDESGDFTTPSAKRTRALMLWRTRAPYRRCLDGTPSGGDPFELYAPYKFLSPSILGFRTIAQMQEAHAEWDVYERGDNGREFKVLRVKDGKKCYKDLDVLAKKIAPVTFRTTKAQALPFLPPKQYYKRYFELTPEQWRLTNALLEESIADLADGGTVSTTHILTKYLRYQQIACGYVPPDIVYGEEAEPIRILPGPNPRLEMAIEELKRSGGRPTIVWTRFKFDIDLLAPRLRAEGFSVVTYDGRTSDAARADAVTAFQSGDVNIFLGNPAAGGRGLNLQRAERELFYANYFGLRRRLQAEDRGHRIGTVVPVLITDLVGHKSIDLTILRALRNGMDVANILTGDPAKDWI